MKRICIDLKYLITLWAILFCSILLTFAHHGNFIIDCGREAYYPAQILLGKVLYRDIFNIYGPFSYMFNALLFKVFSVNLNVLYIAGSLCAFLITSLIYKISTNFISAKLSFIISLFTIIIGVLNTNLFNFIFPYSYAILYGLCAFLVSFYFLLKYQQTPEKTIYLYLCGFLAGLCVVSKYEFLPFLLVYLYAIFSIKKLKPIEYYHSTIALIFVPVVCFGSLILQGATIDILIEAIKEVLILSKMKTLIFFYQTQGAYFHPKLLLISTSNFLITFLILALLHVGFKKENIFLKFIFFAGATILSLFFITPSIFMFIPILIFVITILQFKKIKSNNSLFLLVMSALLLSSKIFWGLTTLNYGVYFASFLILTIISILLNIKKLDNYAEKSICTFLLIVCTIFSTQNIQKLGYKNSKIETSRGIIFTEKNIAQTSKNLIKFIEKNTKKNDKIAIYPEGLMINFMTNRQADNRIPSLIPLYVESLGENGIISYFKKNPPDYIIFNNWNTNDYYYSYFGVDYAVPLTNYIVKKYTHMKTFENEFKYLIYKKQ